MSTFAGLNTAASGLHAHKRAIDVVGHNIANVNTPGYSRRLVGLAAAGSSQVASRFDTDWSYNNLGVTVESIQRVRDGFLDAKARAEGAASASANRARAILGDIERIFPEPSDNALGGQLAAFWGAFADAANDPTSLAARTGVLGQATTVIGAFRKAASELEAMHRNLGVQAEMTLEEVNQTAAEVALINGQIRAASVAGLDTSDLADHRDVLIDQLTAAVGATTRANEYGQVDVILGGTALVSGSMAERLRLDQSGSLSPPLDAVPVDATTLRWERDDYPVVAYGGDISGMIQGLNDAVPRYMAALDAVAAEVVTAANAVHRTGQGQDAVADVNLDFFDATGLTAATIAISADVAGQPSRVALSAVGTGGLDGSVGHALAALGDSTTGPDAVYRAMVGQLGVETATAVGRADMQARFATEAENQRQGTSGVNLDEEMTNLVMSQRAYEASARLLATIDSLLDTLINRTGIG